VPPRDSKALAREINGLLDDEVKLSTIRKRAYTYCRSMVWSSVARSYLDLFDDIRSRVPAQFPTASDMRSPIAATNLPMPKIDHLLRLSDDTGPARHALHAIPDWNFGYSLDDAAVTLVASAKFYDIYKNKEALKLTEIYLAFIQTLIDENDQTQLAQGLDYTRRKVGKASNETLGKVIWALGYMVLRGPKHLTAAAYDLFHQVLPPSIIDSPRGAGYAVLGASNYMQSFPGATAVKRFLFAQLKTIEDHVALSQWWEKWNSADWPVAAQVFCVAARHIDNEDIRKLAKRLIAESIEITASGTVFLRQGSNPEGEELPATSATFIEALGASFYDNRDSELLKPIRSAIDWFLGANRVNAALYNFSTGGCHDALTSAGINRNQGTESTVYCLLAFLSLNQIIGLEDSSFKDKL
ncbi:MAG: hypothetical protein JRJ19_01970, partial [Deltaproteobacteria bacterium]|nr:hypothetical protein [Deltaproteobacteria bacterium]